MSRAKEACLSEVVRKSHAILQPKEALASLNELISKPPYEIGAQQRFQSTLEKPFFISIASPKIATDSDLEVMKEGSRPTIYHHRVNERAGNNTIDETSTTSKRKRMSPLPRENGNNGVRNGGKILDLRCGPKYRNTKIIKWKAVDSDRCTVFNVKLKTA